MFRVSLHRPLPMLLPQLQPPPPPPHRVHRLRLTASAMKIPFVKYHGLGNDFILIDNRKSKQPVVNEQQAASVCDRHCGVGGDGVIFALPSNGQSDFSMRIFNSDGSEPEMCGNGIRCLAKFVADIDQAALKKYKIDTLAGLIQPELLNDGNVRVDMGEPILDAEKIPTHLPPTDPATKVVIKGQIEIENDTYSVTAVSMGNPHACIYAKNNIPIKIKDIDLYKVGPIFENHNAFPARVNTEFVEVLSKDHVKMVVWERGAGPTRACGTGACALVVAGVLEGHINRTCQVDLPGGPLTIEWDANDNHVYMTGPAERSFYGTFEL